MPFPKTFYICVTIFETQGFGAAGDPTAAFDDVVDQFIAARSDGQEARVYRVSPGAGTSDDQTLRALGRAFQFWNHNRVEAPAWAMADLDEAA